MTSLSHSFRTNPLTMTSASPNYLLIHLRHAIVLLLILSTSFFNAATASAGQQSSSSHHSSAAHVTYNKIIPVKQLNFHGPVLPTDTTASGGTSAKNEFYRLNNRRYYGGRVTRAQVHEAVVQTARDSHTNEIYVMGVASMN